VNGLWSKLFSFSVRGELVEPQKILLQEAQTIDNMAKLNVLVIGDTILDEYQYCEAIGKSSKDPVLALKYQSHDLFAGGVLAVANHVANSANSVKLVTVLGERDSHEDFIHSQLTSNIDPLFIVQDNAPILIKRRFI
jgi:bifunctional ADP-heptose synthase (sugar kinase/adenylyltransferase)